MTDTRHPMQPVELPEGDVPRFKQNAIVRFLLEEARARGVADMNSLARMTFSKEDWTQFTQLLGYTVSGFEGLSYVDHADLPEAKRLAEELLKARADSLPLSP